MRLAFFDDLEVPPEEAPPIDGEQLTLTGLKGDEEEAEDEKIINRIIEMFK